MGFFSETKQRGNKQNRLRQPKILFGFHGLVLHPFRQERQAEYYQEGMEGRIHESLVLRRSAGF
jgi:hypothetical protein